MINLSWFIVRKLPLMNHFCYQKKFVRWDRNKCLEQKKEICHHNKFEILSEEIRNEELSADSINEKVHQQSLILLLRIYRFHLQLKIKKLMIGMSHKIYCLHRFKI